MCEVMRHSTRELLEYAQRKPNDETFTRILDPTSQNEQSNLIVPVEPIYRKSTFVEAKWHPKPNENQQSITKTSKSKELLRKREAASIEVDASVYDFGGMGNESHKKRRRVFGPTINKQEPSMRSSKEPPKERNKTSDGRVSFSYIAAVGDKVRNLHLICVNFIDFET